MTNLKIAFTMLLMLCSCETRECLRSHNETRHINAWTQFIYIDKTMIPIFHPQYDYEDVVCDEYTQEKK